MRIQQTDQILKEARINRHSNAIHHTDQGVLSRMWRAISNFFHRNHA